MVNLLQCILHTRNYYIYLKKTFITSNFISSDNVMYKKVVPLPYAQADTPFIKDCIYRVIDDDRSTPRLEDPAVRHVNTIECLCRFGRWLIRSNRQIASSDHAMRIRGDKARRAKGRIMRLRIDWVISSVL